MYAQPDIIHRVLGDAFYVTQLWSHAKPALQQQFVSHARRGLSSVVVFAKHVFSQFRAAAHFLCLTVVSVVALPHVVSVQLGSFL